MTPDGIMTGKKEKKQKTDIMNTRRIILGTVLLLAVTATGCDKKESPAGPAAPETPGVPESPTAPADRQITFTTEIAATRAPQLDEDGSGSFTAGDTFTLYARDDAQGAATLDYTVGSTALYWRDLTFAAEGGKVHFAACYPKQSLSEGGFDFTATQDAAGDLLWASAAGVGVGTEQPVALTFRHALHRLAVKYTVEDTSVDASKIETRCTTIATARVELSEGRIRLGDTEKTFTATNQEVSFLVLPQPTENVTLEIHAGGMTRTWKLSQTDFPYPELEGGKQVTVNLTVQEEKITLAGLTIEGWGDQGSIDDEIIL